ncbi:hypothetical protein [Fictibacillus gelatini]|uniref:hypothetical protein n=1 Tax=Fictibacillus gelatini TaxID=225985 RepID=UPI0004239D55|nr:hypothetical protein [Fictibacillus gelatini]
MKPFEIEYSRDSFDQWRLSQVGGQIAFNKHNQPVFQFKNREQYNRYLELNSKRGEVATA